MPLHSMTSLWPFFTWGIDIIGKIHLTASNGHEFILVVVDYFTKWVEATSCKVLNVQNVCKTPLNIYTLNLQITNSSLSTDNGRVEKVKA